MLYRIIKEIGVDNLVIIGIKPDILYGKNVWVSDGNAASKETNFFSSNNKNYEEIPEKIIREVDREWWSELVPTCVPPEYISKIYVGTKSAQQKVETIIKNKQIPFVLKSELFFQRYQYLIIKNKEISVDLKPELFFLPNREIKIAKNLTIVEGDMFFSGMQTLTITVNTVGIMGKGLALRTKYQFPDVYVKYQDVCKSKELDLGKPYLYKRELPLNQELSDSPETLNEHNLHTWFLLFPTKRHWQEKARLENIEKGLKWILMNYKKEGIKSLAVPALGCGLGGLEWKDVGPLMVSYLKKLEIPVRIYLPLEKEIPDNQLTKDFLLN